MTQKMSCQSKYNNTKNTTTVKDPDTNSTLKQKQDTKNTMTLKYT